MNGIQELHRLYVELTGMALRLDMAREQEWVTWIQAGHTAEDLRLVVAHLKRGIREGERRPGALKFRNLIGQVDYFEEDLAMAKALARKAHVDSGRAAVLRATGRPAAAPSQEARQVGDVMAAEKAFEDFKRLKEML
jgi:hypothetical protein